MAEDQPADVGGEPTFVHNSGGSGPLSPRDAARSLTDARNKANAAASPAATNDAARVSQPERAPPATAAEESAPEADAARRDDGPGEDVQEVDPAIEQQPSIEPPERWTHEARAHWQTIPRETQDYIVQRELERDRLLLQSKNEADEQLKGLTAREQAMEQARLQFESATQAALQGLQAQLQGEFADIQTMDDAKRLADQDWARYLRWDIHQKEIAVKMAAVQDAQQRQAQEAQTKFAKFADEQDKAFITRVPEFANKDRAAELQGAAIKTLKSIGFSDDELGKHWNKQETLSLRDARMQELIHKAARWDEAQEAKKTVVAKKELPPVQRPGVASSGKPDPMRQIQAIDKEMVSATSRRAVELGKRRQDLVRQMNSR